MRTVATIAAAIAVGLACAGPLAAQGGATITGRVRFTGPKPTNPTIDMSEEPQCKAKYQTPPRAETVVVNPNGTLANVFVYVKSGLPADAKYPTPTTPVVIDQDGCHYRPHVLGVMVGQQLEIRNSDPLLHNIKARGTANRGFNISQPRAGMKTTRTFSRPEVMVALECNVHGWMNAYVGVLPHPFFAVTGTDGAFTIKGLPPGTYTLEAWHEKYGTRTATVTVTGTETKTAEFTFAAQ
ncbi:MAG TPA: carboxypeptidase regulatory-like domain-containing protein [Gemmatimonadales bacterium]|nr:carboxypeptidase regulatory-like domain-containing protein [Gemmatimonadales bacterium]